MILCSTHSIIYVNYFLNTQTYLDNKCTIYLKRRILFSLHALENKESEESEERLKAIRTITVHWSGI